MSSERRKMLTSLFQFFCTFDHKLRVLSTWFNYFLIESNCSLKTSTDFPCVKRPKILLVSLSIISYMVSKPLKMFKGPPAWSKTSNSKHNFDQTPLIFSKSFPILSSLLAFSVVSCTTISYLYIFAEEMSLKQKVEDLGSICFLISREIVSQCLSCMASEESISMQFRVFFIFCTLSTIIGKEGMFLISLGNYFNIKTNFSFSGESSPISIFFHKILLHF